MSEAVGILILAGGEATRLPGKLELAAGELPMIVRVLRNVAGDGRRPIYISCKATFPPEVDRLLPVPMVVDRWSLRGPLAGLVSTMEQMSTPLVFAVAGDAPFVDAAFIDRLAAAWRPGDEAVVPAHAVSGAEGEKPDGEGRGAQRWEPLAALYDRRAFVREAIPVLRSGRGTLRLVIDRLRTRIVEVDDPRIFTNVNTPDDYRRLRALLAERSAAAGASA